ncbi:MAG: type IX secretion system membrane protein PorP/SprF [Flavobacteriales bacterium]
MKRLAIILTLIIGSCFSNVSAQDAHFTQFYAAPTLLNPAFVGTSVQSRFGMNYRNQWPALPQAFVTYNAYYDQYMPEINSGIGLLVNHDKAGVGALTNTSVALQYAYEIRLSRTFSLRPALQLGYTRKTLHIDKLVFGDQLIRDGADATFEFLDTQPVGLMDLSSGLLLYSEKYWFGASAHHLNEPNETVTSGISQLSMKLSAHGGMRVKIRNPKNRRNKKDVVFAFNYKQQAEFNQLDLGAYVEMNPMVFGLWYRGLPLKDNGYSYANREGLNILVGYHDRNYKIGYSIDVNLSQLGVVNTGGAHEISFTYEWANKRNRRLSKRRIIPCAKF